MKAGLYLTAVTNAKLQLCNMDHAYRLVDYPHSSSLARVSYRGRILPQKVEDYNVQIASTATMGYTTITKYSVSTG